VTKAAIRVHEALVQLEQRHVVASGHDDRGRGEGADERARGSELAPACALGEIAAEGDRLWLELAQVREERVDYGRVLTPEVRIGEVR